MEKEEIELLLDICSLYRSICYDLNAEIKLDSTRIIDTLERLKSGEYLIVENPDY